MQTKGSELFVRLYISSALRLGSLFQGLHTEWKSKPFLQVLCISLTSGSRTLLFSQDLTHDYKKVSGKVHDTAVGSEILIRLKNSMHLKTSSFSVVPALWNTNRQWIYGGLSEHLWKDDKSKQQPQLQCFYICMYSTYCGSTLRLHSAYGGIMKVQMLTSAYGFLETCIFKGIKAARKDNLGPYKPIQWGNGLKW